MIKKKKINNKIFNKTKKSLNNNVDILKITSNLSEVKEHINKKNNNLLDIETKALIIKSKMERTPKNVSLEHIMEDLPAVNLRELEGDFSKKLRYKDLIDLHKMNKNSCQIIEEQQSLISKEKILNIELLQKQIEILLDD